MSKIGVIHYNFPGFTLDQFFQYCKDTGYQYMELQSNDVWDETKPDDKPEQTAEALKKRLDKMGLQVSALAASNNFLVAGAAAMAEQAKRMERMAKLARLLGASILRTEGGWSKDEIKEDQWVPLIVDGLKRCAEFAPKLGIFFALDNHGIVTNDGDREVEIFKRVGSKHVGANMDTMNYRWAGHSIEKIRHFNDIVAPYTLHTHIKDGTGTMQSYKGAALGEGEIDLPYAVAALKRAGYKGVWVAEYEGPEPEGGVGYRKCYEWLKKNI
jgi:sugar phosphate isomerase/epimerase